MNKKTKTRSTTRVIVSFISLLLIFTCLAGICQYSVVYAESETTVDHAVTFQVIRDTEEKLTGEIHNVRVRASYSNPNDLGNAKLALYLWDDAGTGQPISEYITLLDLVDNRLLFQMENNPDLSITVEYSKDDSCLYFELTPGSSVDIELNFLVPNGSVEKEGLILEPKVLESDEPGENLVDDPTTVFWTADYVWENLTKYVNGSNDDIFVDVGTDDNSNALSQDLVYTFAAEHEYKSFGGVWTDRIQVKDTLTLPDCIAETSTNWVIDQENGKITSEDGSLAYYEILTGDMPLSVESLKFGTDHKTIEAIFTVSNPNRSGDALTDDIYLNDLSVIFYGTNLDLNDSYNVTGRETIKNDVSMEFIPADEETDPISLDDDITVWLMPVINPLLIDKEEDTSTLRYWKSSIGSTAVNYDVIIQNTGRADRTGTFFDVLPENVYLSEDSVTALKEDGYTLKHIDILYQSPLNESHAITNSSAIFNELEVTPASAPEQVIFTLTRTQTIQNLVGTVSGTVILKGSDGSSISQTFSEIDLSSYESQAVSVTISGGESLTDIASVEIQLDASGLQTVPEYKAFEGDFSVADLRILGAKSEYSDLSNIYTTGDNSTENIYVRFISNQYWDSEKVTKEIYPVADHKTGELPRIAFDLYTSTMYDLNKIVLFGYVMINDDWQWVDVQLGPASFALKDSTTTSDAIPMEKSGNEYKTSIQLYFEGDDADAIMQATKIQAVGLKVVGSGSTYWGNFRIENLRLEEDAKGGANYLEKEISIEKGDKFTASYEAVTTSCNDSESYNTAFFGNGNSYIYDDEPMTILATTFDVLTHSYQVSISKVISGRYSDQTGSSFTQNSDWRANDALSQANLTTLGEKDILFYTVTVRNDGDEEKEVKLVDANPLYGNYNYWQGNETLTPGDPGWTARYNKTPVYETGSYRYWNNTVPLRMWGYDTSKGGYSKYERYVGRMYDQFINALQGDYDANGVRSEYTILVPAHTELKQTFVLDMREVTDYALFEAAVRQAASNQSGLPYMNAQTLSGNGTFYNNAYAPTNTVFIKGRGSRANGGFGATVMHRLPSRFGIRQFVAGAGIYKDLVSSSGYYSETYTGVFANYFNKDTYNILNDNEEYIIYGVTILNDSTEGFIPTNATLRASLPTGVTFVELLRPADAGYRGWDGVYYPQFNSSNEPRMLRTGYVSNAGNWRTTNPYYLDILQGSGDRWFGSEWPKWTDFELYISNRDGSRTQEGSNYVTFYMGTGARMPAYTSFTFYYLCKVNTSQTYGSTLNARIDWEFNGSVYTNNEGFATGGKVYISRTGVPITFKKTNAAGSYSSGLMGAEPAMTGLTMSSITTQKMNFNATRVNLAKAVVGRNSYERITAPNNTTPATLGAQTNNFRYNMNYFSAKDNEVITFMIAVANEDKESSGLHHYTVVDNIPSGLEFLGCHTINTNYYTFTSETQNYSYYLSSLLNPYPNSISGYLDQTSIYGKGWVTYDSETVRSKTLPMTCNDYNNYYYYRRSGNSVSFDVYQAPNSVTYIFYSCRVTSNVSSGTRLANTAMITSGNGKTLSLYDTMVTSDYTNSYLHLGTTGTPFRRNYQNVAMGTQSSYGGPISATVYLTAQPAYGSYTFEKTAAAAYDRNNYSKNWVGSRGNGEVYYENGISIGTALDGRPIYDVMKDYMLNPKGYSGNIMDVGAASLGYSLVDGIHSMSWYRRDQIWHVSVKNDSDNSSGQGITLNASNVVDLIDQPFKLYGYSLTLFDSNNIMVGTYTVDYRGTSSGYANASETSAGYTSKVTGENVTRNRYTLDLAADAKEAFKALTNNSSAGTRTDSSGITYYYNQANAYDILGYTPTGYYKQGGLDIGYVLSYMPCGYYYDLYLYTELTEDALDWYYNTSSIPKINAIDSDWVTSIATDGIYHQNREVTDDGKIDNDTSKDGYIGVKNDGSRAKALTSAAELTDKTVDFTMEMISHLYQTSLYQDGTLDHITMYALLPGLSGGFVINEPGGGFVVDTDSYNVYILRSATGEKEAVDASHYTVSYSYDPLHGGRHPNLAGIDDTAYNVDFEKAADESIWMDENDSNLEISDIRALRVVFDDSIVLANGDRLFVDYSAAIREDAVSGVNYRTIFGYIYNLNANDKTYRLYEDTTDSQDPTSSKVLRLRKENQYGDAVTFDSDAFIEFKLYRDANKNFPVFFKAPVPGTKNRSFTYVDVRETDFDDSEMTTTQEVTDLITSYPGSSGLTDLYNLPVGPYYFEEVTAPNGYKLNPELQKIEVSSSGVYVVDRITDESEFESTSLTIKKVDHNGELISDTEKNAVFVVPVDASGKPYSSDTGTYMKFIDNGTDEEKGHIYTPAETDYEGTTVTELETYKGLITVVIPVSMDASLFDTVYFFETQAPGGFELGYYENNRITWNRYLTEETDTLEVVNDEKLVNVIIDKTNSNSVDGTWLLGSVSYQLYDTESGGEPLAVATRSSVTQAWQGSDYTMPAYRLADETDTVTTTTLTTRNGLLYLTGLAKDKVYYLEETSAPSGYKLDSNRIQLPGEEQDEDDNYLVHVKNVPLTGTLVVKKFDADGNALTYRNAQFNLYDLDGNLLKFSGPYSGAFTYSDYGYLTTVYTINGVLKINSLPEGIYRLEELPMSGFQALDPINLMMDYSLTTTKEIEVQNLRDNGAAEFTKVEHFYDSDGNLESSRVISESDAHFEIRNADDELVAFVYQMANAVYVYNQSGATDLTTVNGVLSVTGLPIGTYRLVETAAPTGFDLGDDLEFTITSENYFEPYTAEVVNLHKVGNMELTKYDVNGDPIKTAGAVFTLTDEDGETVKFSYSGEISENGREYVYDENGTYTRLNTYDGKISVKGLPQGNYILRETVAPAGYSRYDGTIGITITDKHYVYPLQVSVIEPDYIYNDSRYPSASWKKIEELDNPENLGYGYFGQESDYEVGNKNYIVVDGQEDLIRYTISVGNISESDYERLVLIDTLPAVGDVGVINQKESRDSQFTVKLAEDPDFKVYLVDPSGSRELMETESYAIGYTNNTSFNQKDFDGQDGNHWYSSPNSATAAFRVCLKDTVLPAGYSIQVEFNGLIQSDAEPGLIAWNSFGYRYYVGNYALTPEPPKVGVMIPAQPKLTKLVENSNNRRIRYFIDIYEAAEDGVSTGDLVHTLTLRKGQTVTLLPKRIINGVDNGGYLEPGKRYIIKERTSPFYNLASIEGIYGSVDYDENNSLYYILDYDDFTQDEIEFTNVWPHGPGYDNPPEDDDNPPDGFNHLPETGITGKGLPLANRIAPVSYYPTGLTLSMPTMNQSTEIVFVDLTDNRYPVEWLGMKAGLLADIAWPGEGHAIIAAHNTLNSEEIGPFADISDMHLGDRFFIEDENGELMIYEVYANEKIGEHDGALLIQTAEQYESTLTLLTCEDERPEGGYASRRIVTAKQIR